MPPTSRVLSSAGLFLLMTAGGQALALGGNNNTSELNSEVVRVSPKRTAVLMDVVDGGGLRQGALVSVWFENDFKSKGVVRKLSSSGRALVRIAQAAPAEVAKGDPALMTIVENGNEGEALANRSGKPLLKESSLISIHRADGVASSVELSVGALGGSTKVSGGSANEDVDFAFTSREIGFAGQAGYTAGSISGGFGLNYRNGTDGATADVNTDSTGTKDKDAIDTTSSGYTATPYVAYRMPVAGMSLGLGVGFQIGQDESERTVKLADVHGPHNPVTTTENGVRLELVAKATGYEAGINMAPSLTGKTKEDNSLDVDHKASSFSGFYASNYSGTPYRAEVSFGSGSDKYTSADLKSSSVGFAGQVEMPFAGYRMAPGVGYTMSNRELGDLKASAWELTAGSRVALSGAYAPYAGLSFKYKSQTEDASGTKPEYSTGAFGVSVSGGVRL